MKLHKHTRKERVINNVLYFAIRAFRGSFVLMWLAVWVFGFTNVIIFAYAAGITGAFSYEIVRFREQRRIEAFVMCYFGVPENVEYPALE